MGAQPGVEGTACEGTKPEALPITAVLAVLTQVPLGVWEKGGLSRGQVGPAEDQLWVEAGGKGSYP